MGWIFISYYYVSYYDISFLGYTYRLDALSLSSPFELAAKVIDVDWERKYGGYTATTCPRRADIGAEP